jgi:hypothetical protein
MESIYLVLGEPKLEKGAIQALAQLSELNLKTLRGWRLRLKGNPMWRPYLAMDAGRRVFRDEEERYLAHYIRREYLEKCRYLAPKMVNRLALRFKWRLEAGLDIDDSWANNVEDDTDEDGEDIGGDIADCEDERADDDDSDEAVDENWETIPVCDFRATNCWRKGFLKRNGLAIRKPHLKRRPIVTEDTISEFTTRMQTILEQVHPELVYNCDETSWVTLPNGIRTIANRGQEGVSANCSTDPKQSTTAIMTINAAGEKLAIWLICKGKTTKCEKKTRETLARYVNSNQLQVTHQQSGWCDKEIAKAYLIWLRFEGHDGNERLILVWDVFAAHRDEEVKKLAEDLNIELIYIPPGTTDKLQPLDRRIFGSLKRRARARYESKG